MNATDETIVESPNVNEDAAKDFAATLEDFALTRGAVARRERARDVVLAVLVIAGLASVFALSRWLDLRRPAEDPFASYEEMYVKPETARRMSLAFNGLAADWYWLRSLQYVGRKVDAYQHTFTLDDMGPLGMNNLGALLEQATTLDPQFMAAYEFGAVVLPSIDRDAAVRLVEKGIRENPHEWRLYHQLGYIHWQAGRFKEASEAYATGARLAGAPNWMHVMAAQMNVQGGSPQLAREMYQRMYEEATDEQVRTLALRRLAQLTSLDERERIRRALADFQAHASRCPASWREVAPALRALGLKLAADGTPLDPTGLPYTLDDAACDVKLDERSEIPKK
jgi:tetratricopeptide (TPR) repeat protein